jgi:carbamate kinase
VRIVVALGGNALLRRGEKPDADIQLVHVRAAAEALVGLATEHELLLCHGNGPQVGLLALESASDESLSRAYPLDALVAQTQGMIGYWLTQCLRNAGVARPVVCLPTQTLVSAADPAFARLTKFVGAGYPRVEADALARVRGWTMGMDGQRWRRVVASPEPQAIVEMSTIRDLVTGGSAVICGGGGGVPVTSDAQGRLTGVEAVVDKDLVSAMLAEQVDADLLLVLTDVPAVMAGWGTPEARQIRQVDIDDLRDEDFAEGSMGPKITACRRFVGRTGGRAVIGALEDVDDLLAGRAGTTLTAGAP